MKRLFRLSLRYRGKYADHLRIFYVECYDLRDATFELLQAYFQFSNAGFRVTGYTVEEEDY